MIEAKAEAAKDVADAKLKEQNLQLDQARHKLEVDKFEWQKKVDAAEATLEAQQDRPVGIGDGK